jgi:hypothetical protein
MNETVPTQAERWEARRERYLRDPLPVRLGELASSLASARSASKHPDHRDAVKFLLEESAHYLEWTYAELGLSVQMELEDLKRLLAEWRSDWQNIWDNPMRRAEVAHQAGCWSDIVLERSGLLDYDDWRILLSPVETNLAVVEECV